MLADGRVLITGGQNGPVRNTAEIYNPVTDSFTTVGAMATPRYQHTMTLLADGSVLVAGGFDENDGGQLCVAARVDGAIQSGDQLLRAGGRDGGQTRASQRDSAPEQHRLPRRWCRPELDVGQHRRDLRRAGRAFADHDDGS